MNELLKELNEREDIERNNILNQIPTYNYDKTQFIIRELEEELDEQKRLNDILKAENYIENIQSIKKFTNQKKEQILEQLKTIQTLYNKLKTVINENKKLEQDQDRYTEIINSNECSEVACKLKEIKELKKEIKSFLCGAGVQIYSMK